jgi:hypothetical protein
LAAALPRFEIGIFSLKKADRRSALPLLEFHLGMVYEKLISA